MGVAIGGGWWVGLDGAVEGAIHPARAAVARTLALCDSARISQ